MITPSVAVRVFADGDEADLDFNVGCCAMGKAGMVASCGCGAGGVAACCA
jgi:hypothetical protein